MKLGKHGAFCFTDALNGAQLSELAQRVEQLGYAALWYPEARNGHESFALASFLLCQTKTLLIGSGIASIYARDGVTARLGQHTLARLSGGRFVLGLGVTHAHTVEQIRGHVFGKPVPTMRAYLDAMDRVAAQAPQVDEPPPTVLAALGPLMLRLAAQRTAGALPYNVTPEHTARARKALGPERWLIVEQKVVLQENAVKAREAGRQSMGPYMTMSHYRNNWQRLGFNESDFSGAGSDRFIDAMVAWGSAAAIRERVQAHFEAGADHVCIQPLHRDGLRTPDLKALEELAP